MTGRRRLSLGLLLLVCAALGGAPVSSASAQTKPEGEVRFALYVTLSPLWFDPAEVTPTACDYVWPSGVGPRVAEPALMLIDPYPWVAPYEEIRLKK
jgi:ABC-type transport system substrate-binding protein